MYSEPIVVFLLFTNCIRSSCLDKFVGNWQLQKDSMNDCTEFTSYYDKIDMTSMFPSVEEITKNADKFTAQGTYGSSGGPYHFYLQRIQEKHDDGNFYLLTNSTMYESSDSEGYLRLWTTQLGANDFTVARQIWNDNSGLLFMYIHDKSMADCSATYTKM